MNRVIEIVQKFDAACNGEIGNDVLAALLTYTMFVLEGYKIPKADWIKKIEDSKMPSELFASVSGGNPFDGR